MVGGPDQTPEHQDNRNVAKLGRGFWNFLEFKLTDEESTAGHLMKVYVKVSRDRSIGLLAKSIGKYDQHDVMVG